MGRLHTSSFVASTSQTYDGGEIPVERAVYGERPPKYVQWFSIAGIPGGQFMTLPFNRQPTNREFTGWTPLPPLMPGARANTSQPANLLTL